MNNDSCSNNNNQTDQDIHINMANNGEDITNADIIQPADESSTITQIFPSTKSTKLNMVRQPKLDIESDDAPSIERSIDVEQVEEIESQLTYRDTHLFNRSKCYKISRFN
jgi:hypothetical protein